MRSRGTKTVALRLFVCLAAFTLVAPVPSEAQSKGKRSKGKRSAQVGTSTIQQQSVELQASTTKGAQKQRVEPWSIEPPIAVDVNSDPDVVEVEIVASSQQVPFVPGGAVTEVWTYNGSTPGPTIEGKVGDTLIVHFYNQLAEETTIHWHGVEVPANMDGSNISQGAVPPGGYFRYEFKLLRPSLFWYHPHVRSNEQVEKGLYGALLVRDPVADAALGLPEEEHLLVLDDILLAADGSVVEPFPNANATSDYDKLKFIVMQANGREGNTLLVNGQSAPTSPAVMEGVPIRLRVVNAANTRIMRLSIPGHNFYKIGGDGGLLQAPVLLPPIGTEPHPYLAGETISKRSLLGNEQGIVLTPGERADIVFTPRGNDVSIELHDFLRGRHAAYLTADPSQRFPPLPDYLDGTPPGFGALDVDSSELLSRLPDLLSDDPFAFGALDVGPSDSLAALASALDGDGPDGAAGVGTPYIVPVAAVLTLLVVVGFLARRIESGAVGGGAYRRLALPMAGVAGAVVVATGIVFVSEDEVFGHIPPPPGAVFALDFDPTDGLAPPETLLTLEMHRGNGKNAPPAEDYVPPVHLGTIDRVYPDWNNVIRTMFGHSLPDDVTGDMTFFAQMKDGMGLPFGAVTPQDAPTVAPGQTAVWNVINMTGGIHNFHLHGFEFQVLEHRFVDLDTPAFNFTIQAPYLEDKDTVQLPLRPGAFQRSATVTRLAVRFDDTGREGQIEAFGKVPGSLTSGGWLFHCHLLEHGKLGMMSFLQVVSP